VGHIGKQNGPKAWQEPVTPLVAKHEIRMKLSPPKDGGDMTLYLTTTDAGDGSANDAAIWENARLVAPGRSDMPLRHVPQFVQRLEKQRAEMIANVEKCLAAAHEVQMTAERTDIAKLAQTHGVEAAQLAGWLDYLGIGSSGTVNLEPLLVKKVVSVPNYNFIQGWTGEQALSVLANSSDESVRTPGIMKAHSVATHPSPSRASVIAWRSPVSCALHIHGNVADAHSECGNGITWELEVRRGHTREVLASGVSKGAELLPLGPFEKVRVLEGDVVALVIGPRDGNHSCDLTAVNLTLSDGKTTWDLAKDVSPNILAGNPHGVWHFLSQPAKLEVAPAIPGGSLLAMWRKTTDATERQRLAQQVQQLLERGLATVAADSPNRALHSQLLSFNGPLLAAALNAPGPKISASSDYQVQAPSVIEVKLPASLVDGAELVTGRLLHPKGSVQMQVLTTKPEPRQGLAAVEMKTAEVKGMWSDNNLHTNYRAPVIVNDNTAARRRFEAAFDEFRSLFPIALCYAKIVPVDEVVTLTLFHREDDQLQRLMLDDAQIAELDRLWDELRCVSE
jgi:hypothetical protein